MSSCMIIQIQEKERLIKHLKDLLENNRAQQMMIHKVLPEIGVQRMQLDQQISIITQTLSFANKDKDSTDKLQQQSGTTSVSSSNANNEPNKVEKYIPIYNMTQENEPKRHDYMSEYNKLMKKIKDIRKRMTKLSMGQRTANNVVSDFNSIQSVNTFLQNQNPRDTNGNVIRINMNENQYEVEEELRNGGGLNNSLFSRFQSTMSLDDQEENDDSFQTINKRKDPEYNQNRFKFTITEDKILQIEVLSKINYEKEKLKDFPQWKSVQDKHLRHRPVLELARRCHELIDKYHEELNKRQQQNNQFEEEKNPLSLSLAQIQNLQSKQQQEKRTQQWTEDEDEILMYAVSQHGDNNWREVANYLDGHTSTDCRYRYVQLSLNRQKWTPEEDLKLMIGVHQFGKKKWSDISEYAFDRTRNDVQCRERYVNKLDPQIDQEKWNDNDDMKLEELVHQYGFKWAKIQEGFEGRRTDSQCKRRWTKLVKQRERQNSNGPLKKYKRSLSTVIKKQDDKFKQDVNEIIDRFKQDPDYSEMNQSESKLGIDNSNKKRQKKKQYKQIFKIEKIERQ